MVCAPYIAQFAKLDDLSRMLCSNPTGAVYPPEHLELLAGVLRKHPHVLVVADEIYERITYGHAPAFVKNMPAYSSFVVRYDTPHLAFASLDGMLERY